MKPIYKILLSICISALFISCATSNNELAPLSTVKPGVAQEGTLANHVLAQDASLAIRQIMGGQNNRIVKFVVQKPVGQPGMKAWRELWIYDPEGMQRQFIVTFRENGQGSADFDIKPM